MSKLWPQLKEAYRKIGKIYERANMIATLGYVDRWRRAALSLFYKLNGGNPLKVLDAGAGPGNMARHVRGVKYVVALDAVAEMLSTNEVADDKVVGVFEYLPFRRGAFNLAVAGFSLHASWDIERALSELAAASAYIAAVSIGKPDNAVIRALLYLYSRLITPFFVCLLAGSRACAEYRKIYLIIRNAPPNSQVRKIVEKYAEAALFREAAFGSVYIFASRNKTRSEAAKG